MTQLAIAIAAATKRVNTSFESTAMATVATALGAARRVRNTNNTRRSAASIVFAPKKTANGCGLQGRRFAQVCRQRLLDAPFEQWAVLW